MVEIVYIVAMVIAAALFGFIGGFALGVRWTISQAPEKLIIVNHLCPHGFEDWDKCPDCCH